jgi:hypothetical protein
VRETALDALLEIYSNEENVSPLHGFTGRFQHRFAELVYDVDEAVAVKGVRLITQLVQAEEMPPDEVRPPTLKCIHLSCNANNRPIMVSWSESGPSQVSTEEECCTS